MTLEEFKEVKVGDKVYMTGKSKFRGRCVVVTNKYTRYVEVDLDGNRPLYSYYAVSINPVDNKVEKKKKPSRAIRDNLLVTMGCRAGHMHSLRAIELPGGSDGEDELAEFVSKTVDRYINEDLDIPFDSYIEEALEEEYPVGTVSARCMFGK